MKILKALLFLFVCSFATAKTVEETSISTLKDKINLNNTSIEIRVESFKNNIYKGTYTAQKPIEGALLHDFIDLHRMKVCRDTKEPIVVVEMINSLPDNRHSKNTAFTSIKTNWSCTEQTSQMKSICDTTKEPATQALCKQLQE